MALLSNRIPVHRHFLGFEPEPVLLKINLAVGYNCALIWVHEEYVAYHLVAKVG
jgi:hypothetical protein